MLSCHWCWSLAGRFMTVREAPEGWGWRPPALVHFNLSKIFPFAHPLSPSSLLPTFLLHPNCSHSIPFMSSHFRMVWSTGTWSWKIYCSMTTVIIRWSSCLTDGCARPGDCSRWGVVGWWWWNAAPSYSLRIRQSLPWLAGQGASLGLSPQFSWIHGTHTYGSPTPCQTLS